MNERQPRWKPGDGVRAEQLNQGSEAIDRLNNLSVDSSHGLELIETGSAKILVQRETRRIYVKITSGGTAGKYGGQEQIPSTSGTFASHGRTFDATTYPLYELNLSTTVSTSTDLIVEAWYQGFNWWFVGCM